MTAVVMGKNVQRQKENMHQALGPEYVCMYVVKDLQAVRGWRKCILQIKVQQSS